MPGYNWDPYLRHFVLNPETPLVRNDSSDIRDDNCTERQDNECEAVDNSNKPIYEDKIFNSASSFENAQLPTSNRMLLRIHVAGVKTDFLYDTGSQYTMIPRKLYEQLRNKPPLQPVLNSGIGVDSHKFLIDGIVYLNLKLVQTNGSTFAIEYEPVLVSSHINIPIYGMNTENKFSSCSRDNS